MMIWRECAMRGVGAAVLLSVAVFFLAAEGVCRAENLTTQVQSRSPIQITSDRLDAYDDEAFVLFSGNVVATQDDAVIHADKLYLYYEKKTEEEKKSSSVATTSGGKIERIELRGNVHMKKGERIAIGDRAVFHNADQTVVMTGNAVMREGENVITGDKVTVFLNENRGVVESSSKEKRVTAVIYPEDDALKKGKPEEPQKTEASEKSEPSGEPGKTEKQAD